MTDFEKMAMDGFAQQADGVEWSADYLEKRDEINAAMLKELAKASEILALLQRHIPADRHPEVEAFLFYDRGALPLVIRRDLTARFERGGPADPTG